MKKIIVGIGFGVIAGILDIIPMVLQKLPLEADISAFTLWVVSGFLIAITDIKIHPILKGIIVSFLVLAPSAVLIGWKEPMSLIPITIMTLILGAGLGLIIEKTGKVGK